MCSMLHVKDMHIELKKCKFKLKKKMIVQMVLESISNFNEDVISIY